MSENKHWLCTVLKEIRLSKNLTQKQLSKITNVHVNTILRIEKGKINVSFLTLEKILESLEHEIEIHSIDGSS